MNRLFYILIFVFIAVSCSPMNKESYIKKFDTFVSDVSNNYKNYSEKDWEKKTQKFDKFSGKWYDKFKNDLTWQEKLKVTGFQTKFHFYKALSKTSSLFDETLNMMNTTDVKSTVQNFINNGQIPELKQLYEQYLEIGKESEKFIKEILNELQINIDELLKE